MVTITHLIYLIAQPSFALSPENIKEFADYLMQEGDYLRAAGEYERYMILTNSTNDDSLLFKIGQCYLWANQPQRARQYFARVQGELKEKADYEIAESYYQEGEYRRSLEHIMTSGNLQKDKFLRLRIKNLLFLRDFASARILVHEHPDTSMFARLALSTSHLPYRSQPVAGMLSAIIPGLGKGYAGRWADGFFSLLVVGITGWQAYDGFRRDGTRSTKGWIYGTLCFGFYAGDIWGSLVATKQYNRQIEDRILRQLTALDSLEKFQNSRP